MFLRSSAFAVLFAIGSTFSVVACTADTALDDSLEQGDEAALTARARAFVGSYTSDGPLATGTGSGDFATLELKADGTYDASVDATIAPKLLCNHAPCTHRESGSWNAFLSGGVQKLRVSPSGSAKRTYELASAIEGGSVSLTRDGVNQVLLGPGKKAKIAGYGFDGPKILNALGADVACPEIFGEEEAACQEGKGIRRRAEGCAVLCSIPIAPRGKVAGFDFVGHKVLVAAEAEICTQQIREEQEACSRAKGKAVGAKGCKTLCSHPIARTGKVAGFDFDGLQTSLESGIAEFCTEQVRPEEEACSAANGKTTRAKGCHSVCSVPIAPR